MLETAEQNATSAPVKSDMEPIFDVRIMPSLRSSALAAAQFHRHGCDNAVIAE